MTRNLAKTGVRAPYTFAKVKHDLLAVHDKNDRKKSMRGLAKKYGVSHGVIQRIMTGIEPKSHTIRAKLNLSPLIGHAPLCPKCGQMHIAKRCIAKKIKPPWRRIWQRCAMNVWGIIWGEKRIHNE